MLQYNGTKVGVITDIGIACKEVIRYFKQCHACFLESNYDEQMLEQGSYPLRLKDRIRGGRKSAETQTRDSTGRFAGSVHRQRREDSPERMGPNESPQQGPRETGAGGGANPNAG